MRITVSHRTLYRYDHPIRFSTQYLRLTPRTNMSQRPVRWLVDGHGRLTSWVDGFGNLCHTLVCHELVDEVLVEATGVVDTVEANGVMPDDGVLPIKVFLRPTPLTRADAAIREFVAPFVEGARSDPLDTAHALSQAIIDEVAYREGSTDVQSTAAEVLTSGQGVCQDMAHLFIACCRALGLPARYISGYLYTGEQETPGVASHAWASVWVEKLGWVSFDLANQICGTERHVGLAVALDYAGAAPIRGIRLGGTGEEIMNVQVMVREA